MVDGIILINLIYTEMKRLFLTLSMMLCLTMVNAQEEFVIDFNNYTTGTQCLNGQDSWATHYQTAGSSQDFDVDYTAGGLLSPDESVAVFYPYGGAGVGRTDATLFIFHLSVHILCASA